jgi:hypothetical protein
VHIYFAVRLLANLQVGLVLQKLVHFVLFYEVNARVRVVDECSENWNLKKIYKNAKKIEKTKVALLPNWLVFNCWFLHCGCYLWVDFKSDFIRLSRWEQVWFKRWVFFLFNFIEMSL